MSDVLELPAAVGRREYVTQAINAPVAGSISDRESGQTGTGTQQTLVASLPETPSAMDGGQRLCDAHLPAAPSIAETIEDIITMHRERCFWMEDRKRADLALGAYLRTALKWSLDKPASEREAIRLQAAAIIKAGEKYVKGMAKARKALDMDKVPALPHLPKELEDWAHVVVPKIEMRRATDELEAVATNGMVRLAQSLPVAEWANSIRGFGPLGLAIIVAEAGRDLSLYANPGKLWKRMGLAVIGGKRQGKPSEPASKAEWKKHGYNRQRRSKMYTIGISLIRAGEGPYRDLYLDRKIKEREKAQQMGLIVAPSAIIPKGKQSEYRSLGHIDNMARRYVEKRLLRDLWNAWCGTRSDMSKDHEAVV